MAVKVVTDSTADLPREVASARGIIVVPLKVHFGDVTYVDGVDIDSDRFYDLLVRSGTFPTTSQPSVPEFLQVYRALLEQGHEVLSVHISQKLSGTYNSALQAVNELDCSDRVALIDSGQATLGLGLMALEAAELASNGVSLKEAVQALEQVRGNFQVFGVLDTLEYLARGGRIGRARAFLGSLLNIKPMVTIKDGEVHPVERVRSFRRGIDRMLQMVEAMAPLKRVGVIHATTPAEAQELARRLSDLVPAEEIVITRFGPIVGTYIGPGGLGVALQRRR